MEFSLKIRKFTLIILASLPMKKQNIYYEKEIFKMKKLPKHFQKMIGYVHFKDFSSYRVVFHSLYPPSPGDPNNYGAIMFSVIPFDGYIYPYWLRLANNPISHISLDTERMLITEFCLTDYELMIARLK